MLDPYQKPDFLNTHLPQEINQGQGVCIHLRRSADILRLHRLRD